MSTASDGHPRVVPSSGAKVVDIGIIGAGPVGLFAAFYAGMRQMSVKLIDSLDQLGGQLTTLYPEKLIYDVAGFPRVTAKQLSSNLIVQARQARPELAFGQQVAHLHFDESNRLYTIVTDMAEHLARTILIAAGVGAFVPKRLSLTNARAFEDRGLYYTVHDVQAFAGRRVLIVGGGEMAVDWANTLSSVAAELTFILRRDVFRADEASVARLRQSSAKVRLFHELTDIGGERRVERATLYNTESKGAETLSVDAVLVNIGYESSLAPIRHWALTLEGSGIRVDSAMRTNRPGVFAAGDIAAYPGKLKLIATGFGEAATAVNHAKRFLDPDANLFPGHSTSVAAQRLADFIGPK